MQESQLISEDVFFILDLLEKKGYPSMIVGGAVRNHLFGIAVKDIDIATAAKPCELISVCKKHNIRYKLISLKHGTIAVIINGKYYEITTLRKDEKTFGRNADVSFINSFEVDSCRRDFTINAIYMDKYGDIFDFHNGVQDLNKKIIRFIGDPQKRIEEDYLRILRYFRFVVAFGEYRIDDAYLRIINLQKEKIAILSGERIFSELLKIFERSDSFRIVTYMEEILNQLFAIEKNPLPICDRLGYYKSFSAIERICMLLLFSNLDKRLIANKYNLPRNVKKLIMLECADISSIKQKIKHTAKQYQLFYVKYFMVRSYMHGYNIKSFEKEIFDFCASDLSNFSIKAAHFSQHNLSKKQIETIMRETKNYWMSEICSTKQCIEFAMKIISKRT